MMLLTENKEIIYKTFFITGSLALFIGLGNYAYGYYKKTYKDNSNSTNINDVVTNDVVTNDVVTNDNVINDVDVDKNKN
jgi:hypothetical protein